MAKDPLKEDFRNFLYLVWKHLQLPDPTPIQYDIAAHLQGTTSRLAIQAFRGVGKSWVTAAYVLWELYRDPQRKIMVVSASEKRAGNFTTFCLLLIDQIPQLRHLKPKPSQRRSTLEFDVGPARPDQTPSVFARGINGQLTGGRADIIVADDIEIPTNSATAELRDKLLEKIKEFTAILKPYDPRTHGLFQPRIIYLGTPQSEDSIYSKLPETFVTVIWTAVVPTLKEALLYGGRLAPKIRGMIDEGLAGKPTDPDRFTADDLDKRRVEYGASGFQLQFQMNTQLSDEERFPLKVKNLIIADVPPDRAPLQVFWLPHPDRKVKDLPNLAMRGDAYYAPAGMGQEYGEYKDRVLAIDPKGRGSDETGYAIGYQLNGYIWVPEAGGVPGGYDDDTLKFLAETAARHKVNRVVIESNFGDGMFTKLITPVILREHKCGIEEVRSKGTKELRIVDVLEPVMARHKLIVSPDVIRADFESAKKYESEMQTVKTLIYQMTRLTKQKNALRKDDRIDALALLVAAFTEVMDQDDEKKAKAQREAELKAALMEHLKGFRDRKKRKKWAQA